MTDDRHSAGEVPVQAKRAQPKGGSRKGIPNKVNSDLKAMILGALDKAGGVTYLTRCAEDPRLAASFLTLVGKVLPSTIAGADGGAVQHRVIIERRIVDPAAQ